MSEKPRDGDFLRQIGNVLNEMPQAKIATLTISAEDRSVVLTLVVPLLEKDRVLLGVKLAAALQDWPHIYSFVKDPDWPEEFIRSWLAKPGTTEVVPADYSPLGILAEAE